MIMLKEINNKLPKQWAFFGPLWFCWLLVFLGFILWFVEMPIKIWAPDYAPGRIILMQFFEWFHTKQYILTFISGCFLSLVVMSFIIYFPSFWVMLTGIIFNNSKGSYKSAGLVSIIKTILFLLLPILWNSFLPNFF